MFDHIFLLVGTDFFDQEHIRTVTRGKYTDIDANFINKK